MWKVGEVYCMTDTGDRFKVVKLNSIKSLVEYHWYPAEKTQTCAPISYSDIIRWGYKLDESSVVQSILKAYGT